MSDYIDDKMNLACLLPFHLLLRRRHHLHLHRQRNFILSVAVACRSDLASHPDSIIERKRLPSVAIIEWKHNITKVKYILPYVLCMWKTFCLLLHTLTYFASPHLKTLSSSLFHCSLYANQGMGRSNRLDPVMKSVGFHFTLTSY